MTPAIVNYSKSLTDARLLELMLKCGVQLDAAQVLEDKPGVITCDLVSKRQSGEEMAQQLMHCNDKRIGAILHTGTTWNDYGSVRIQVIP